MGRLWAVGRMSASLQAGVAGMGLPGSPPQDSSGGCMRAVAKRGAPGLGILGYALQRRLEALLGDRDP